MAPPWPGEPATTAEARSNPAPMAGYCVGEVANSYPEVIMGLPTKPIVIGHSFGGTLAQISDWPGVADTVLAWLKKQGR